MAKKAKNILEKEKASNAIIDALLSKADNPTQENLFGKDVVLIRLKKQIIERILSRVN